MEPIGWQTMVSIRLMMLYDMMLTYMLPSLLSYEYMLSNMISHGL